MEYKQRLKEIIETTVRKARQEGKLAMFSIATTANIKNQEVLFPSLRITDQTVCGNVLLTSDRYLEDIIKAIDGVVDIILTDIETKLPGMVNLEQRIRRAVKTSKVLTFRPNDLSVDSADALIAQFIYPLADRKIAIIGGGNIGSKLALKLVERNADVYLVRRNKEKLEKIVTGLNAIKSDYLSSRIYYQTDYLKASENADVIVGATAGTPVITPDMVIKMKQDGLILDIGNGTLFPDAIDEAVKRNISIMCLVMKPGYNGALETILQTEKLIRSQKKRNLGKFSIISGGILGRRGDVIVDYVDAPTEILAIADGKGDVIPDINDREFKENIDTVRLKIQELRK